MDYFCRKNLTEYLASTIVKLAVGTLNPDNLFYKKITRGKEETAVQNTLEPQISIGVRGLESIIAKTECEPEYENGIFLLRILRFFLIRVLNLLPSFWAQKIFLAFHGNNDIKVLFDNVGTFRALEVLYNFDARRAAGNLNISSVFWGNLLFNAVSIKNRLVLVKKKIVFCVRQVAHRKKGVIRLLSVGSGSARPVFEAVSILNGVPEVESMLVDTDERAIDFSRRLATELSLNHTQWRCGNFFRLEQYCRSFSPDVVEMVGLLDYLSDKQAVALLKKIFSVLAPEGYIITGNINPNIEAPFITKGVNWSMIYRTPEQLAALLVWAGFPATSIEVMQEPLKVHTIAIAQKIA